MTHPLPYSQKGWMHLWYTPREQYGPDCLTPTVRGSGGYVKLWGTFCYHSLGPFVPLEGRVSANQFKVVLSEPLFHMMKHFYPSGSGLFQYDMVPLWPGHEGPQNGFLSMKMMWIICNALLNPVQQIQCSPLLHYCENIKWGNIFWKKGITSLQWSSRDLYVQLLLFWWH